MANYYTTMTKTKNIFTFLDILRDNWFLIAFIASLIYWAAHQDSSLSEIERQDQRITALENRTTILESGIGQ